MVKVIAISLTDDAIKAWDKLFKGKKEFSPWIQQKLLEEELKEDSIDILRKRVIDLTADIEKLNSERALFQKRIEIKIQEEEAKSNRLLAEQEAEVSKNSKNIDKLIGKIGVILQYRLKLKPEVIKLKAEELAKEYADIKEKVDLEEFIRRKYA